MELQLDCEFFVESIIERGQVDTSKIEDLKSFLSTISGEKKSSNYTEQMLRLTKHLFFHAIRHRDGAIAGFSGVFRHDHYPINSYRVLNRTYVSPAFRSEKFRALNTRFILPEHMQLLKREGASYVFISREGKYAQSVLSLLKRDYLGKDWFIPEGYFQVADSTANRRCFQRILVHEFDKDSFEKSPLKNITLDDWLRLPP